MMTLPRFAAALTLLLVAAALLLTGTGTDTGPALASSHQIDYDTDDDNLIEIRSLEQLNAIRWNRNGNFVGLDGIPIGGNPDGFVAAFPNRNSFGSCPAGLCHGYELVVDLDFDTNGDGSITAADGDISWNGGAGWVPIGLNSGRVYSGTFQGNGHTIANMMINSADLQNVGLFGYYSAGSSPARLIEGVGMVDVDITAGFSIAPTTTTGVAVGALVGHVAAGSVRGSYATGKVSHTYTNTGTGNTSNVGGLVGYAASGASIAASYAQVDVTMTSASSNIAGDRAGGLVGTTVGSITACYATGSVTGSRTNQSPSVGGLAGYMVGATVRASYATGRPTTSGFGTAYKGGLVGLAHGSSTIENSYWDRQTSGETGAGGGGTSQTTSALQTPEEYGAGIYANWNVNADGDTSTGAMTTGADDPWHFGTDSQYPILKYGHNGHSINRQRGIVGTSDYDGNDNNLIDITTLAELDAIRYDLDGDGHTTGDAALSYMTAFPTPASDMGCPGGCRGYELTADLDFDTGTAGDRTDDDYYNGDDGWTPIAATADAGYTGKFIGNGHTIANLYINYTGSSTLFIGLFGNIGTASAAGEVSGVGLSNASVASSHSAHEMGTLAGRLRGGSTVTSSWATGSVTSTSSDPSGGKSLGGLAGFIRDNNTAVRASWAGVTVSANAAAGEVNAGGLVGRATGGADVIASYATGAVSGGQGSNTDNGGLVGYIEGTGTTINASYATGAVSAGTGASAGGLVGDAAGGASVANSYWDRDTSGQTGAGGGGASKATPELRSPTAYAGTIYAAWNLNLDGRAGGDDPWDFGGRCHYPALRYGGQEPSQQRGDEDDEYPGNDLNAYPGQVVTLDGSDLVIAGATGERDYLWEQYAGDADAITTPLPLEGAATAQATFTTPTDLTERTIAWFRLTIIAGSACVTDRVKVTILPAQLNELISLTVTAGAGRDAVQRPLTPAFVSNRRSFDTYVGAYTGRAEIAMTPASADATISFNRDAPAAGARTETVSLAEGHNRFTITVTPPEPDPPADGGDAAANGDGEAAEPLEPVTYHLNIRRQRTPKLAFDPPHYLLMNEGETATYTVELDTRWLGAEVIINISSDNPDITVSPDTVSISQYDWSERTIEVTAAKDADGDDDYATIRHIANGGHYNNVGGRLRVEVSDDDIIPTPTPAPTPTPTPQPTPTPTPGPTPPPVASSDRTTELTLDGQTVTITREAGALLGASVSLPSRLTRDLTITYAPMIAGLPLSSTRYGLGMTPEAQSGVTLTVTGLPAGGLELCLPVPSALASEAGARPLTLVRYEGAGWNALPGAVHRTVEVCAPNISSGVFAAAYTIPQLGPASNLTATPGDAPGTIVLRWTPGNDATRHWIAGIKQSDLDAGDMSSSLIWTAASGADTHTVSGLDSGAEYVFAVAAGRGSEWSGWTALVRGTPQ